MPKKNITTPIKAHPEDCTCPLCLPNWDAIEDFLGESDEETINNINLPRGEKNEKF